MSASRIFLKTKKHAKSKYPIPNIYTTIIITSSLKSKLIFPPPKIPALFIRSAKIIRRVAGGHHNPISSLEHARAINNPSPGARSEPRERRLLAHGISILFRSSAPAKLKTTRRSDMTIILLLSLSRPASFSHFLAREVRAPPDATKLITVFRATLVPIHTRAIGPGNSAERFSNNKYIARVHCASASEAGYIDTTRVSYSSPASRTYRHNELFWPELHARACKFRKFN